MEQSNIEEELRLWQRLRFEQCGAVFGFDDCPLQYALSFLKHMRVENPQEPSDLTNILRLAETGKDDSCTAPSDLRARIEGALIGRFAGCTLGVPVENNPVERMRQIARESGTPFPPTEYWHDVTAPDGIQYGVDKRRNFTLDGINGVPVDDDVTYTVLNTLLLDKYGFDYSVEDVARLWLDILPYACTAEDCALRALRNGTEAKEAADGNPFVEWIGAAIRGDAFGYVCAGHPSDAAKLAYNDAYLTHRGNGIYGEMFTAAAVAAAFVEESALKAVKKAVLCIPRESRLRKDLEWAFSKENEIADYSDARLLLDGRFEGMDGVHTNNNMCAVAFAVMLGKNDFTASVSNAVAIGLDNDCNAATVGSIVGANVGIGNIPRYWYNHFHDTVRTYLKGYESLPISGLADTLVQLNERYLQWKK